MKVCPPIVSVAFLTPPVFAATVNPTLADPVPLDEPLAIVTHDALDVAVHAHVEAEAVTVTLPAAPAAGYVLLVGNSVKVHAGGGGVADVSANFVVSLTRAPGDVDAYVSELSTI